MSRTVVIAVGGNALILDGQRGTIPEQRDISEYGDWRVYRGLQRPRPPEDRVPVETR
jgi:hypothetical protein